MRSIFRLEHELRCVPCEPMAGQTGGVASLEQGERAFYFAAFVMPDRQSERREMGSLRPRERRLIIPRDRVDVRQGDHLYFEEDDRIWRCMQRRDYPLHQQIEVEVEG